MWVISGISDAKSQNVSCAEPACGMREVRLGFGRMDQVGKLHRVLDEEHRDVVADEVPVAFVRVELDREATHVPRGIRRAALAEDGREAHEDRRLFPDFAEQRRARELGDRLGALEEAVRRRAPRMDDALRDALVVEVGDLLAEDEVLEEGRAAKPGLQRVLIVGDRDALVGREDAVGRVDAHAIERTDGRILADVRATAADLVGSVDFADRAGADDRISGLDGRPCRRRKRRVGIVFGRLVRIEGERGRHVLRSRGLLRGDVAMPDASGSAGPLTVVRLFRTVLLFLVLFAGRDDLAMSGLLLPSRTADRWLLERQ